MRLRHINRSTENPPIPMRRGSQENANITLIYKKMVWKPISALDRASERAVCFEITDIPTTGVGNQNAEDDNDARA